MADDEILDLQREMGRLNKGVSVWTGYLEGEDLRSLDKQIKNEIRGILVSNFGTALNNIPEFSSAQGRKLRNHLMKNVYAGDHVVVTGGNIVQLWNMAYAGDYSDIIQGQHAAWSLSPKSPSPQQWARNIFWAAIYTGIPPGNFKWKAFDSGIYNNIIEARMSAWGHKAPYWIFVEFGTAVGLGAGRPYPSYDGQQPIYKTRLAAPGIASRIYDAYVRQIEEALIESSETLFVDIESEQQVKSVVHTKWTRWWRDEANRRYVRRLQYETGRFVAKEAGLGDVFQFQLFEE